MPRPTARRVVRSGAAVVVLATGLLVLGRADPGGLVLVADLVDHPLVWPLVALVAVGVLAATALRPRWLRRAAVAGLVLGCLGWTYAAVLAIGLLGLHAHVVQRLPAPDGRSVLVVSEGAAVIDTVWVLEVQRPHGLASRRWDAGCLNGDAAEDAFATARWLDPTTAAVTTDDGRVLLLHLDPRSGAPLGRVVTGAGC